MTPILYNDLKLFQGIYTKKPTSTVLGGELGFYKVSTNGKLKMSLTIQDCKDRGWKTFVK